MVRSSPAILLGLTCALAAPPARPASAQAPAAVEPAKAKSYALPGEDPPAPFVPLRPRTVEDRKRVEAMTAYSVARALEDRRSWSEAIDVLEQALKLDPDSVTILRRLSQLSLVMGRTEPGIEYCKKVLALEPGDTETVTRLVNHYNRGNDPAAAEAVLKDVLDNPNLAKNAPGRLVARYQIGKLYAEKLRQFDKAAEAYAEVVAALDDKTAGRLSAADQQRILGGDEAGTYTEFGVVFLQAKRYDDAIKAFDRGLHYEPDDPQIPLLLAKTLMKVNKEKEALDQVEQFLKRQPQGVEGYELLGEILTALKREGEITPRLEEAAKNDSKNAGLQYVLAERYRQAGQVDRAEAIYKGLLATQPTAQGYGGLAALLLQKKKADDLLKVVSAAVAKPGGLEAVQEQIKGIVDDPALSDQVLDVGIKMLTDEPDALGRPGASILAYIASRAGKLDKFLAVQQLALKRDPAAQTYREFAVNLVSMKRYNDAAGVLGQMLEKFPEERNARQYVELSQLYRRGEKPEEAVKSAREALKLDPNDSDAQIEVALTLTGQGKLGEAVDLLRQAAEKDQANPGLGLVLGSVLAQGGRNDEAITTLKGVLEKHPNNEVVVKTVRQYLSIAYVNLGDFAKGESELETALEKDPDDATLNNDLGYLYAEQGKNLDKAESMIRKALLEDEENSAYLDSLGWVLFKRGKAKDAVEPLEKAAKQLGESATDATIFEHLGDVYFQLQDTAKARTAWQSAERAASKATPPDKRLPEIRKKIDSLDKLGRVVKPSTGDTP